MKWHVKLLYTVLFAGFAAAVTVMALYTFTEPAAAPEKPLQLPDQKVFTQQAASIQQEKFPLYTSLPPTVPPESAGDLSGKIQLAAHKMVKALLQPDSVLEYPGRLQITSDRTARVTIIAVTPAVNGQPERTFRCSVTVHLAPGGGCEAAFPTVTEITHQTARPNSGNPQ